MFKYITSIKNTYHYTPSTILDIGAYHGVWTKEMMEVYPNTNYILYEAIDYNELDEFFNNENVIVHKNIILNDEEKEVDWYEKKNTGDSMFKEKTCLFADINPQKRQAITLNKHLQNTILKNILIKIDCQGAEIPILKGASNILPQTDIIILEMPFFGQYNENVPNFQQHIQFMESINFALVDIPEYHPVKEFTMQVDGIFIRKSSAIYKQMQKTPTIHTSIVSNKFRNHVVNYIKSQQKNNSNYRVIDIGGCAYNWTSDFCDYFVDINPPTVENKTFFQFNINYESQWEQLFEYVEIHGKFDFAICSHTLEDIALPQVTLNNLPKIAKEGFIAIPSKYSELTKREGDYLGSIHHRWIFSQTNHKLIGYPKLNFIDKDNDLVNIGNYDRNMEDYSFFWKNGIPYEILNDDYMGPNVNAVKTYYKQLLKDDLDAKKYTIKTEHVNDTFFSYHIQMLKNIELKISADIFLITIQYKTLTDDLLFLEKNGFVPFHPVDKNSNELTLLVIKKNHYYNQLVQQSIL